MYGLGYNCGLGLSDEAFVYDYGLGLNYGLCLDYGWNVLPQAVPTYIFEEAPIIKEAKPEAKKEAKKEEPTPKKAEPAPKKENKEAAVNEVFYDWGCNYDVCYQYSYCYETLVQQEEEIKKEEPAEQKEEEPASKKEETTAADILAKIEETFAKDAELLAQTVQKIVNEAKLSAKK